MKALEEAQNMLELLPDLDALGQMVGEFAESNIREALEEVGQDLSEDQIEGFMEWAGSA